MSPEDARVPRGERQAKRPLPRKCRDKTSSQFLVLNTPSSNVVSVGSHSKPSLLDFVLLDLIVRLPTERSHYTSNLWNATFGL